jgi:NAD(P)-dependent dehydrogenase (short-subunit alcohol dehydrogenase family)
VYRRGRATRTVVVTGAASGLGHALGRRLDIGGCRVIGVDLDGADIAADLGTPQGRVQAMNTVLERTGRVIDGLVLCAGLGPADAPPARLVSVNYHGAVSVLDGLRPGLAAGTEPAAVVVVPNTVGITPVSDTTLLDAFGSEGEAAVCQQAEAHAADEVHALTKVALVRAVRVRALEWGRSGIRLNVVARGPFAAPPRPVADEETTGHRAEGSFAGLVEALPIPLERRAAPDDVAGVVAFLLGHDASMVHGAVLYCDGGTDALLRPDHI